MLDGQVRNGNALYKRADDTTIIVPEGLPVVADATVSIPQLRLSATTDSHGDFALRVPAASARLAISVVVTARGFGSWRESGVRLARSGATNIYVQLCHVAQSFTAPRPGVQPYNGRGTLMPGSGARKQRAVASTPDSYSACGHNSSGWTSQKETPPVIRVYMTGTSNVVDYSFEFYEEHVLPYEWSASNPEAALQAGAVAIRDYAWYFVLTGSKGTAANVNPCSFDVDDSTAYQNFQPSAATYTPTDDAVTSTATIAFTQNGAVPETSFCSNFATGCGADSPADSCGYEADGTRMSQIGSVACANAGDTWQQILGRYYYPGYSLTNELTAYPFWMGGPNSGNALFEASGPATGNLNGPDKIPGMGPLNSAPAAAVGQNGYIYAYWEGGPDSGNALWEAYWNGSSWQGPFNRGMGPLNSQPTVTVSPSGTAYVFWEGGPDSGNALYEAYGPATGNLSGPHKISGMGPLNSPPTTGMDGYGNIYVYWEGGPDSGNALWEAYWNGSSWQGPYNRAMGPLGSQPSVAVAADGTASVFWEGGPDSGNALYEAGGPGDASLSGPDKVPGMGPLNSPPTAGVDVNGYPYVYWEGGPDSGNTLWEAYWNGSSWAGPYNRGMGPLGSQPAVAIFS